MSIPNPRKKRFAFRADLHMHTHFSDGVLSPQEMLQQACDGGIQIISMTDHDLPPPVESGWHTVGKRSVYVVSGVELSGVHNGVELHLLVYFPGQMPQDFADFCRKQSILRAERYETARLKIGLPNIKAAPEAAFTGKLSLTRLHLARALKDAGHITHIQEAFKNWLSGDRGYVEPIPLSFVEAIEMAKSAGGFCSWAHPPPRFVKSWLPPFVDSGLDAIEAVRPRQGKNVRRKMRNIALKKKLYITGGSDSHGYGLPLGSFSFSGQDMRYWADRIAIPVDEIATRSKTH